ncbi:sulfite exporter TauE/SafE family protein [Phycisphaerales bacterium AB-hyl4]|uniref:Probable membrane transporter protein n=1 Tax=Natronomicrosphaera hydrolytica TaxID=3242702 RepID=A0ABV4U7G0_9BACT
MTGIELVILAVLVAGLAALYASVGHGGASGYLAAMAMLSVAPASMKPTALMLNILVAGLATVQFARAGHFVWSRFLPFAIASMPLAFVGGMIALPTWAYQPLVAAALIWAAWRLASTSTVTMDPSRRVPIALALTAGALIGLISGLTGVGGGIYLSPLLLLAGWATARQTAAVAAAFVFVNSITGLTGHLLVGGEMPWPLIAWTAPAAVIGGVIGARLGSQRLATPAIRRLLAVVLLVAAVKLAAPLWQG